MHLLFTWQNGTVLLVCSIPTHLSSFLSTLPGIGIPCSSYVSSLCCTCLRMGARPEVGAGSPITGVWQLQNGPRETKGVQLQMKRRVENGAFRLKAFPRVLHFCLLAMANLIHFLFCCIPSREEDPLSFVKDATKYFSPSLSSRIGCTSQMRQNADCQWKARGAS